MGQQLSRRASAGRKSLTRRLSSLGPRGSIAQCRNGLSRLRSVRRVFSPRDRFLVQSSWAQMAARGPAYQQRLILKAWLRASAYSPAWVWESLAGVREGEPETLAETNPRFRHIVQQVVIFLDGLITEHEMDIEYLREQCAALGRRHIDYFREGFQSSYWDSFSVSLVEGIESALLVEVEDAPSVEAEDECWRTLYAWQKFIRVIVDQMQVAYAEEAKARTTEESQSDAPGAGCSSHSPRESLALMAHPPSGRTSPRDISRHSSWGSRALSPLPVDQSPLLAHLRRRTSTASSTKNSRTSSHSSSTGFTLSYFSRKPLAHIKGGSDRALTPHQRRNLYQPQLGEYNI